MRSLINGVEDWLISVQDRGFQFGDGLFETLVVDSGEIKNWSLHWERLCAGCERLFIPQPAEMLLLSEIDHLSSGIGKEIVKIILSRGVGERGYAFKEMDATRVVSLHPWPEFPLENNEKGIELFVCQTPVAKQPALAGIKHLNRLENVLARHEWQTTQYAEGIMLDTEGNVIEGTMSNLFLVKNEKLLTPDLSVCGVHGVIRQRIIDQCKSQDISLEVTDVSLDMLKDADEVFICNSVIGIWPVRKIKSDEYSVAPAQELDQVDKSSASLTRLLQKGLLQ